MLQVVLSGLFSPSHSKQQVSLCSVPLSLCNCLDSWDTKPLMIGARLWQVLSHSGEWGMKSTVTAPLTVSLGFRPANPSQGFFYPVWDEAASVRRRVKKNTQVIKTFDLNKLGSIVLSETFSWTCLVCGWFDIRSLCRTKTPQTYLWDSQFASRCLCLVSLGMNQQNVMKNQTAHWASSHSLCSPSVSLSLTLSLSGCFTVCLARPLYCSRLVNTAGVHSQCFLDRFQYSSDCVFASLLPCPLSVGWVSLLLSSVSSGSISIVCLLCTGCWLGTLKVQCVTFRDPWAEVKVVLINILSIVSNHLFYLHGEWITLQGGRHVSTVVQNGQTKHWL